MIRWLLGLFRAPELTPGEDEIIIYFGTRCERGHPYSPQFGPSHCPDCWAEDTGFDPVKELEEAIRNGRRNQLDD